MNNLIAVFIGGGLGSLLRYGINQGVRIYIKTPLPLATLWANVVSCFVLGMAINLTQTKIVTHPSLKLFILTGFCGGLSTFSAFSFETIELMRTGNTVFAFANILLNITLSFFAIKILL